MVEKVIVKPNEIRGLGNIIIPKSLSDFTLYNSALSSSTKTVNGVSTTVYTLTSDLSGILLTVTKNYVASSDTITITATVTDEDGEPVSGAEVKFYKES